MELDKKYIVYPLFGAVVLTNISSLYIDDIKHIKENPHSAEIQFLVNPQRLVYVSGIASTTTTISPAVVSQITINGNVINFD